MIFGNVILMTDGIGTWNCNKSSLQVSNIHGKVGVVIDIFGHYNPNRKCP